MISQREIQRMAFEHRVPEQMIERDYVLTWALGTLADPNQNSHLVAKGGTTLKRVYFADWRYSEDLDFTASEAIDLASLRLTFDRVCRQVNQEAGLAMEVGSVEPRLTGDNVRNVTAYLSYVGPLQRVRRPRQIKLDVTFDEILCNAPITLPLLRTFSDEPEPPRNVLAYCLEEICAEKLRTLQQRTEPRDLYDLWRIFTERTDAMDMHRLGATYRAKCTHKNLVPIDPGEMLTSEHMLRFEKMWEGRLREQMPEIPQLPDVVRELRRSLKAHF